MVLYVDLWRRRIYTKRYGSMLNHDIEPYLFEKTNIYRFERERQKQHVLLRSTILRDSEHRLYLREKEREREKASIVEDIL